jgi:O-antigen/teichoic acid export membrane protein
MSTPELAPPREFGTTSAPSVVSGGLWTLFSQALPQLQLLVLSVITARYLGPTDMGRQSYIAFFALALVQVATAGLPVALSRFVGELLGSRAGGQALALHRLTRRIERVAALLVLATLAAIAALGGEPAGAWVLAGLSGALAILQAVPNSVLVGAQQWRQSTMPGLITGVATVPLIAIVLAAGGGITGLFAVEVVTVFVNLVWTSALARRAAAQLPPLQPAAPELRRRFLSLAAWTTLITAIEFVVWRRSELFVLQRDSTDAQIAFYSIAFATISGFARLPDAIAHVAMPAVANLLGTGESERIRRGFWRAVRLLALTMPAVVAGIAVTGPALLRVVYGERYADAGTVLLVLVAPLLLQPFISLSLGVLYGLERPRFIIVAGLVAAVVDVGLALVLIPSLEAVGAAIANGCAQIVAGVPCLVLVARLQRPRDAAAASVALGLAMGLIVAVAAAAALTFVGSLAAVVAGVLAFLVVALLVRPFPADDGRWLAGALRGTAPLARTGGLVLRLTRREPA